jgi:hypothetical protein
MTFNSSFQVMCAAALAALMIGCEDSKPTIDPKGPQPPPSSNEEVDSAMGTSQTQTTEVVTTTQPIPPFDVTALPGVPATQWTLTPGGSWYATVLPGSGDMAAAAAPAVSVTMTMWTMDGTPVLPTEGSSTTMILPMGVDMFPGWNETIEGMKIGELRKIAIPYDQSLGGDGHGLVFCEDGRDDEQMLVADVKLIGFEIEPPPLLPSDRKTQG